MARGLNPQPTQRTVASSTLPPVNRFYAETGGGDDPDARMLSEAVSSTTSTTTTTIFSASTEQPEQNGHFHLPGLIAPSPSLQETQAATEFMFREFVQDHLPADIEVETRQTLFQATAVSSSGPYDGYADPCYALFGRDLRRIAQQLEASRERQEVREKSEEVDIKRLNADQFRELLMELFCDGQFTRERIVVLFFFCTDLAIRGLKTGSVRYFSQFFKWSLDFIMEYVCLWVQRQGGWGVVLGEYLPRAVVVVTGVLACIALSIFIKRNLWP